MYNLQEISRITPNLIFVVYKLTIKAVTKVSQKARKASNFVQTKDLWCISKIHVIRTIIHSDVSCNVKGFQYKAGKLYQCLVMVPV